jgi:hypothetical protein
VTAEDVRALLRQRVDTEGSALAWSRRHGMSTAYVLDALAGRRSPGPAILRALGLEKETRVDYREAARG